MENELDKIVETCVASTIEENAEIKMINDSAVQFSQTYNVIIPEPEDKIILNASEIHRIKALCQDAKMDKFSLADFFLGIASLLLGAFLSAIISRVQYEFSFLSVFLYTICPAGGIGFGVAYFLNRKREFRDAKQLAKSVENCLGNYEQKRDNGVMD